jgi:hypothetical protein
MSNLDAAKKAMDEKKYPLIKSGESTFIEVDHSVGVDPAGSEPDRNIYPVDSNGQWIGGPITMPYPAASQPNSHHAIIPDMRISLDDGSSWQQQFLGGNLNINNHSGYHMKVKITIEYE